MQIRVHSRHNRSKDSYYFRVRPDGIDFVRNNCPHPMVRVIPESAVTPARAEIVLTPGFCHAEGEFCNRLMADIERAALHLMQEILEGQLVPPTVDITVS